MKFKKNKKKIIDKFKNGTIEEIETLTPNVADKSLSYIDKEYNFDSLINEEANLTRHNDAINVSVFIYMLLSSKMKKLFSITESIFALTAVPLLEKFDINISTYNSIMSEGNVRDFINDFSKTPEITEQQLKDKIKEIENKNKKIKEEDKKKEIDEEKIKKELQNKQNGHNWIKFFNNIVKRLLEKIEHPVIHILDCVKIPVNTKNSNYELSTVINYEGKAMRGYKMGVLRAVTNFGGLIEYLIDGTISNSDISLVEDEITNYEGFRENDITLMDRGFAKIEFIINLVKRGIRVIVPVKKNMDIYKECIKIAKETKDENWEKHPNQKREGQDILLIKNLKGIWISEKDRNKKPEKILENAIDFSGCVVRIEKKVKKNKEIIQAAINAGDETDELYEDDKYLYIVIITTDTNMSAADIVRYYELRPEIEEDFRQLKDIWKMCNFTSTKYIFIMCQTVMMFLGYNIFNLFKNSEQGKKYINKSMRKIENEEKRTTVFLSETNYLITSGNNYAIFSAAELLDLYADCSKEIREKLKSLLFY